MNTQDYIVICGKPIVLPEWLSPLDMPSDSQDYMEYLDYSEDIGNFN